jgi:hypothetical protein
MRWCSKASLERSFYAGNKELGVDFDAKDKKRENEWGHGICSKRKKLSLNGCAKNRARCLSDKFV